MVKATQDITQTPGTNTENLPPVKWTSISINEVIGTKYRLEASVYGIEGRQARDDLNNCKWPLVALSGKNGLSNAYHRPRFKRIFVEKSDYPIYQPSQINEIYPSPTAFISDNTPTDIDALRVNHGHVLLTCSGTIGNCAYVRKTLDNAIFSHDLIRINPKSHNGYIYAFLKSKIGSAIINTNNYGAVISHIEPEHLNNVQIPDASSVIKQEIHDAIEYSYKLRDESNDLMNHAQSLLKQALSLPDIQEFIKTDKSYKKEANFKNFNLDSINLNNRLDASYHLPIVRSITSHLQKYADELTYISDNRITKNIVLPGRFKRVYVEEGSGIVFFGGKQIHELDPSNKKYLSLTHHGERIKKQLILQKNTTLITCSGTIGKVNIVPEHWDGWTANQHIIRVVPKNNKIAGYLYAWLSSEYAYYLITRNTYGAVVDEIDNHQVANINIPLIADKDLMSEINNKVLNANKKRKQANEYEQSALHILDEKVFYAQNNA